METPDRAIQLQRVRLALDRSDDQDAVVLLKAGQDVAASLFTFRSHLAAIRRD